jgi:NAD(P)-dependent dehydrogenase (short-subunit alcohol dehydrogenase family)
MAGPPPAASDAGRVVIVTGGNSGIGLGIARGFARSGASVAIWSRRADRNASAVAELEGLGAMAIGIQCDVSDEDNVTGAMRATLGRFGRLDCLVANAGTAGKQPFTDMPLDEWRRVLQVNLDGAFLCLREAARVLVGQGQGGSLVAVSSTSAIDGAPGQQHYAASKTALLAVIRALAVELARHQVRCNSLLPGWTDTELLAGAKTHEKFVTRDNRPDPGPPVGHAARLRDHRGIPRRPFAHLPHRGQHGRRRRLHDLLTGAGRSSAQCHRRGHKADRDANTRLYRIDDSLVIYLDSAVYYRYGRPAYSRDDSNTCGCLPGDMPIGSAGRVSPGPIGGRGRPG